MTFLKYFWRNSKVLIAFCIGIMPLFILGAYILSGWSNDFYWVMLVLGGIFIMALVGDWIKFKGLL